MVDPTPTEIEAIKLRWRAKNPEAGPNAGPTLEEQGILLQEIRERAIAIENESLRMLMSKMRVRPYKGNTNSRNSQFLFVLVGLLVLAAGFYMAMNWLFSHQ